ncbi:Hypothetical protein NTJ_06451 [Nesidiocoris tenuis]|uniref:EF-hand domain-containing protein n=1 Tax=Nesidiocoris tenuis TaxID=355587 RepID=A0ABN7AN26_9HEMI|nr:Hypothetical protein NTJ_06451 [Nesidiocoris tenuis]
MFLGLWLILPAAMAMRGPHHPRDNHVHYKPKHDGTKLTQDANLLHDTTHIQEDLGDTISEDNIRKMTPDELEFHYFKLHDFDNNTKLDGLEILQAIRHTLEHEEHKIKGVMPVGEGSDFPADEFHHYIDLIDQVLAEDDTDHDGYLSYVEYVVGRQRDNYKKQAKVTSNK